MTTADTSVRTDSLGGIASRCQESVLAGTAARTMARFGAHGLASATRSFVPCHVQLVDRLASSRKP